MTPTEIKASSLRLLLLSPAETVPPLFPPLLEALTGTAPTTDQVTAGFAGYTQHETLRLSTKYYSARVNIWCDEVPLPNPVQTTQIQGPAAGVDDVDVEDAPSYLVSWREQMLSDTAAEVRGVIGGIVLALPVSASTPKEGLSSEQLEIVEAVNDLRDVIEEENYSREVAAVVLLQSAGGKTKAGIEELDRLTDKIEGLLLEERGVLGWNVVGWDGEIEQTSKLEMKSEAKNAYGEKIGIERVREVLEALDWSVSTAVEGEGVDLNFFGSGDEDDGFGVDPVKLQGQELEREMMGLKLAMAAGGPQEGQDEEDEDTQIEHFPGLLERVVAIKEAGADMGKDEREQFAKREIAKIMKNMG